MIFFPYGVRISLDEPMLYIAMLGRTRLIQIQELKGFTKMTTTLIVLKLKEVVQLTGLSRSTLWRLGVKQDFPRAVILSPKRRVWFEAEVLKWMKSRPRA